MLILNRQKVWVPWPAARMQLLLSPLLNSKRQELYEAAHVPDPSDTRKKPGKVYKPKLFQDAVADQCIHDWKGDGEGATGPLIELPDGTTKPQECTPDARHAFMEIDLANAFVFATVQGLSIHMLDEAKTAGNVLPGTSAG